MKLETLTKYGLKISNAARHGDKEAQEIIYWYEKGHSISDNCALAIAEKMAIDWVKTNKEKKCLHLKQQMNK